MPEKVQVDYQANTAQAVRNVDKYGKATKKVGIATRFANTALTEYGAQLKSTFFGFFGAQLALNLAAKAWEKITENSRLAAESIKRAIAAQNKFVAGTAAPGKTPLDIEIQRLTREGGRTQLSEAGLLFDQFTKQQASIADLQKAFGEGGELAGIRGGRLGSFIDLAVANNKKAREEEIRVITASGFRGTEDVQQRESRKLAEAREATTRFAEQLRVSMDFIGEELVRAEEDFRNSRSRGGDRPANALAILDARDKRASRQE